MKKPGILMICIFSVIVALVVVRITVLNSISTTGIELVQLQNEIDTYKKQNVLLEEQYLEASSLTNIQTRAEKMGFVTSNSQIYLPSDLPLALKQ